MGISKDYLLKEYKYEYKKGDWIVFSNSLEEFRDELVKYNLHEDWYNENFNIELSDAKIGEQTFLILNKRGIIYMIKKLETKTTKPLLSSWVCFVDGRNCERYSVSTIDEINTQVDKLIAKGYRYLDKSPRTIVYNRVKYNGFYWVVKTNTYYALNCIWDKYDECKTYILYYGSQPNEMSGTDAKSTIENYMKLYTREEWSFKKAYSIDGHNDVKASIKECVMTAFDYANTKFINKEVRVVKEDISSAYVSALLSEGGLPTLKGFKKVEGRVSPTKEFPFAFYNDGTLAIYDEFDSLSFRLNEGYKTIFNSGVDIIKAKRRKWQYKPNSRPITYLCKKETKYNEALKNVFTNLFNHRKDNEENKFIMVAAIGSLHMNSRPYCSHVAAVVISRCIYRMILKYNEYKRLGLEIVLINTDSIAASIKDAPGVFLKEKAKNKKAPKRIGEFHTECINGKIYMCSVKKYQLIDDDNKLTTKFSGYRKELKDSLKFGEISKIDIPDIDAVEVNDDGKGEIIYG